VGKEDSALYIVDLALRQGATDVVAEIVDQDQMRIRFSNNEVTVSKACREVVLNVFVMVEGHRAASTVSLSSAKALERTVKNLIRTAKMTPPTDVYAPLPKGPFRYDSALSETRRIMFDPDKLTGYVQEAMDSALEEGATKVAGTMTATKTKTTLATSGDIQATQIGNGLEMSARAFVSDIATGHSVSISRDKKGFRPDVAGRMAGQIAKAASDPREYKPGRFTALLGPMVFADLVGQVGTASSAFQVDTGRSFLADRMGLQIASEKFTLTDDPTLAGSFGARAFDDEGIPTQRNTIIDKGFLKTYLHNSTTAKRFGVETTANAGLISPNPWNLVVEPGDKSFDDLSAEVDKGIYVTNDWYLRYQNYRTGDFSTIPRDGMFLIEKGRISASIRELRISDNMLKVFRNIIELTESRSWIKWWEVDVPTLTPYALVEDLNFTKPSTR